jgi:hypothetical protein
MLLARLSSGRRRLMCLLIRVQVSDMPDGRGVLDPNCHCDWKRRETLFFVSESRIQSEGLRVKWGDRNLRGRRRSCVR